MVNYKKMRYFIAVFLMVVLLFTFGVAIQAQTWKKFPGVHLTFMWYPSPEMDAVKKLLPEFTKETGIKVTLMEVPHEAMYEKLMMEAVSGAGIIDLAGVAFWWVDSFARAKYIECLEPYFKAYGDPALDDLIPEVIDYYRFIENSRIYAIPLYPDVNMIAYNKEMLKEAGVSIPETWEEFRSVSQKLQKDTNGDGKIDQWGAVLNLFRDESVTHNFAHFLYMNHGDFIRGQYKGDLPPMKDDPTKYMHPVFNNELGVEALTYLVQMYQEKTFSPGSINYSFFDALEAFILEKAAMYPTFADQAPMMYGPESKITDKVGFAPLPTWKGVRRQRGGGWGISIMSSSKNKEAAYEFIRFFYGNIENAKKLAAHGKTPSRYSVLADEDLVRTHPWYPAMKVMLPVCKPDIKLPEAPEIIITIAGYLQAAFTGKYTPKEALDIAAAKVDEIMKRAGYYR